MLTYKFFRKVENSPELFILLHGRNGTLDVMQIFKSCIPESASIVSVQAPQKQPEGGYAWWEFDLGIEFTHNRNSGALAAANNFNSWLDSFLALEGLKPDRIMAIGFSQGAALLSCIAQIHPERFCAIAMLAGFVVRVPALSSAELLPKIYIAHGTNDPVVPFSVAQDGVEYLRSAGFEVQFTSDDTGHKIGVQGMKGMKTWIAGLI